MSTAPTDPADLARHGDAAALAARLDEGLPVDQQDDKGNTFLMLAAYHGHAETVALLLQAGAAVDLRNAKGQTPLGGAAFKGHAAIVALLLDAGADPLVDQGGTTAADLAAVFGRHEVLTLLRERRGGAARPARWYGKLAEWLRTR